MKQYRKFLHYLSTFLRDAATVMLTVMICTYFLEITRRTIIHKSFLWIQELNVLLVVWVVFFGAAHMYLSANLLNVDFLYVKSKGLLRLIWTLVIHLVSIFILYVFARYGYTYMMHLLPTKTNAMVISNAWTAAPLVISSTCMILGWVSKMYEAFEEYGKYKEKRREKNG